MDTGRNERKRHAASGTKRHGQKKEAEALTWAGRRRLFQLVTCLLLFAFVFVGRGIETGGIATMHDSLARMIQLNTDFRSAFSRVGASVAAGEPAIETFGVLCTEMFGEPQESTTKTSDKPEEEKAVGVTGTETTPTTPQPGTTTESEKTEKTEPETPFVQLPKEQVPEQPAPEASKADGALKDTVTPVMGVLTSHYGYRTHPIDGEWKFHNGVDLKVNEGTPILAFADGKVEYVGESDAYGLYMQIKHENGFSSFYAHCSELCVPKGRSVKAGQKIAEVGQTGNTTGPHLHFELKKDGKRIDPISYIETQK